MERTLFKLKTGQIPDEKQYLYAISSAYLSQQIVVSPETEKFCLNFVFFLMRSQSNNHFRLNCIGKGKNLEDGSTFFFKGNFLNHIVPVTIPCAYTIFADAILSSQIVYERSI